MKTYGLKRAVACPCCHHKFDSATAVLENAAPTPGDITVCIQCTAALTFTEDGGLRELGQRELDGLALVERDAIAKVSRAIMMVQQMRAREGR